MYRICDTAPRPPPPQNNNNNNDNNNNSQRLSNLIPFSDYPTFGITDLISYGLSNLRNNEP